MTGSPAEAVLVAMLAYLSARRTQMPARFLDGLAEPLPAREAELRSLPVTRHLDRAAAIAPAGERPLASLLALHCADLAWRQTYGEADFGRAFLEGYGWVELFGTRGHFVSDSMAGGFLVLGPGITYPDHRHEAEEIYLPLTGGTRWRLEGSDYVPRPAGSVIHHRSNASHAMRTAGEPLVALYLWRGGPLAQRSVIG